MTLPIYWPRTSCVYCGARIMDSPCRPRPVISTATFACVQCRILVTLDPEYQR